MNIEKNFIRLPKFLKPLYKTDLIRIGKKNDGGYCISESSLKETNILYSFGLNDDWSFEKEFRKKSGAKVICFDHSVTLVFWVKRLIKDILQFLKKPNLITIKRFFTFFHYKLFFNNSDKIHEKKFFGSNEQFKSDYKDEKIIDMKEILRRWPSDKIFMKIDIEGSEYRILEDIIENQSRITGLAIEFHDCDLMVEKIKLFIERFNLDLVHIHVNNYGLIKKNGFPTVIELTFSHKKYNLRRDSSENNFPIKNLDQPNNKNQTDDQIFFYK